VTAGLRRRAATLAVVVLGFGCFAAALGGLSTIGADLRAAVATTTPATQRTASATRAAAPQTQAPPPAGTCRPPKGR
jgi:hypothetical protein